MRTHAHTHACGQTPTHAHAHTHTHTHTVTQVCAAETNHAVPISANRPSMMHGQYSNDSCSWQKCESWSICRRCTQCQTRCLCRCCLPEWKRWKCPLNQSRLSVEATYLCRHVRSGYRFADTWTTRKSLLGVFGRNFETIRTVYSADKKWEFA